MKTHNLYELDTHNDLKQSLECDAEYVTKWLDFSGTKANPENYQEIALGTKSDQPTSFNKRGNDVECSEEVKYCISI